MSNSERDQNGNYNVLAGPSMIEFTERPPSGLPFGDFAKNTMSPIVVEVQQVSVGVPGVKSPKVLISVSLTVTFAVSIHYSIERTLLYNMANLQPILSSSFWFWSCRIYTSSKLIFQSQLCPVSSKGRLLVKASVQSCSNGPLHRVSPDRSI